MKDKLSLYEATAMSLYNNLVDDVSNEEDQVQGLVDGIVVVTDPEIDTEQYQELIDRADELIEDTPEGEIPMDETYLGQYVQLCPICGSSFIEDHMLEPGSACPICYDTPESFVMLGQLNGEEDELKSDDVEGAEEDEEVSPTPDQIEDVTTEHSTDSEDDEKELEKDEASKDLPKGNILTEEKDVIEENKEVLEEVKKEIETRVLKLDDNVEVEIEIDVTPGFEKEIKKIWYTDWDGSYGFSYDIKTDKFIGFDNPDGSFLTPIEDEQIKDEIHKILSESDNKKDECVLTEEKVEESKESLEYTHSLREKIVKILDEAADGVSYDKISAEEFDEFLHDVIGIVYTVAENNDVMLEGKEVKTEEKVEECEKPVNGFKAAIK